MSRGKTMDAPEWFFMWNTGRPYITAICGWTKRDVIAQAERENHEPWKKIYGRGGRVIRCKVTPQ